MQPKLMANKSKSWDAEQGEILKGLIDRKVSLARASVILKRSQSSVQVQARKLGLPFPGIRETKRALKESIADAEARAGVRRI